MFSAHNAISGNLDTHGPELAIVCGFPSSGGLRHRLKVRVQNNAAQVYIFRNLSTYPRGNRAKNIKDYAIYVCRYQKLSGTSMRLCYARTYIAVCKEWDNRQLHHLSCARKAYTYLLLTTGNPPCTPSFISFNRFSLCVLSNAEPAPASG